MTRTIPLVFSLALSIMLGIQLLYVQPQTHEINVKLIRKLDEASIVITKQDVALKQLIAADSELKKQANNLSQADNRLKAANDQVMAALRSCMLSR